MKSVFRNAMFSECLGMLIKVLVLGCGSRQWSRYKFKNVVLKILSLSYNNTTFKISCYWSNSKTAKSKFSD